MINRVAMAIFFLGMFCGAKSMNACENVATRTSEFNKNLHKCDFSTDGFGLLAPERKIYIKKGTLDFCDFMKRYATTHEFFFDCTKITNPHSVICTINDFFEVLSHADICVAAVLFLHMSVDPYEIRADLFSKMKTCMNQCKTINMLHFVGENNFSWSCLCIKNSSYEPVSYRLVRVFQNERDVWCKQLEEIADEKQ
ncbi:MAG: hypothetical protein UU47_C0022G0005 [candidate division TM6 bacterium GW2011_GWE2_41_16]|nr:MAG: hypothetical protein UU47_C0022G0005 [candidate division TM6 bacterium GW2011_GWE2_41_16]